jgi:hypothetical protein
MAGRNAREGFLMSLSLFWDGNGYILEEDWRMNTMNMPLQEAIDQMVLLVAKMAREKQAYEDALYQIRDNLSYEDCRSLATELLKPVIDLPPFLERRCHPVIEDRDGTAWEDGEPTYRIHIPGYTGPDRRKP